MGNLLSVMIATALDGLTGLIGAVTLLIKEERLNEIIGSMVAFAAGTMLGGAIVHMIPRVFSSGLPYASEIILIGFLSFFLLERYLHWHHCHKTSACDVHPVTTLTILGDALHNFIDGVVIAAAFHVSDGLGWLTTLIIVAHEVPQELGNYSVLLLGGLDRVRALIWTFISQLTCVLGGVLGWFFLPKEYVLPVVAFTAGGFLYVSASDLIPMLHEEPNRKKLVVNSIWLFLGITFMVLIKYLRG